MSAFGVASPAKPARRYRAPSSIIMQSSSARSADGDPNVEDMVLRGVWGLGGPPPVFATGDRMLATFLCKGPPGVDVDMMLKML
jgi:hypothetical protein